LYECQGTRFLLTAEVNTLFYKGGKAHQIHHVLLAPSLDSVERINQELAAYGPAVASKPQLVAATKMDIPAAKQAFERFEPAVTARGVRVLSISAITGQGLETLLDAISQMLASSGV